MAGSPSFPSIQERDDSRRGAIRAPALVRDLPAHRSGWFVQDGQDRYPIPPRWVTQALELGFQSRSDSASIRPFFGLISTPCESCMAGLIALGAQLRVLSLRRRDSRSIDRARYFRFLRGLQGGTILRSSNYPNHRYALQANRPSPGSTPSLRARQLGLRSERCILISEDTCDTWRPEGDVPEEAGGYDGLWLPPEMTTLQALVPAGEEIPDERLRFSSTEVVLVGPPGGVPAFRAVYEEHCGIGASGGETPVPLSRLLRLRGWAEADGSHACRGVHINALSPAAVTDAKAAARRAVLSVFDGAAPFLKLGDYFRKCDRIVVASRSLSNSLLERLCSKLHQDQHDSDSVVDNGSTWLAGLPATIQAFCSRPRRREATA